MKRLVVLGLLIGGGAALARSLRAPHGDITTLPSELRGQAAVWRQRLAARQEAFLAARHQRVAPPAGRAPSLDEANTLVIRRPSAPPAAAAFLDQLKRQWVEAVAAGKEAARETERDLERRYLLLTGRIPPVPPPARVIEQPARRDHPAE